MISISTAGPSQVFGSLLKNSSFQSEIGQSSGGGFAARAPSAAAEGFRPIVVQPSGVGAATPLIAQPLTQQNPGFATKIAPPNKMTASAPSSPKIAPPTAPLGDSNSNKAMTQGGRPNGMLEKMQYITAFKMQLMSSQGSGPTGDKKAIQDSMNGNA